MDPLPSFNPYAGTLLQTHTNISDLVDALTKLCDQAKGSPARTEYKAHYGTLILYAITESGGALSLSFAGQDPVLFEHKGPGTTILGWCENHEGFSDLEDTYSWAASDFQWLPSKPLE